MGKCNGNRISRNDLRSEKEEVAYIFLKIGDGISNRALRLYGYI